MVSLTRRASAGARIIYRRSNYTMPIYKPGKLPQTGISWVDALARAMHEDPTMVAPTPLAIRPKGPAAKALYSQFAKKLPKMAKASEKIPDTTLQVRRLRQFVEGLYESVSPYGPRIRVSPGAKNPLKTLIHEVLHALYTKKFGLTRGYPPPEAVEKIASRFLDPKTLRYELSAPLLHGYSQAHPSASYGEAAIKALAENIFKGIGP